MVRSTTDGHNTANSERRARPPSPGRGRPYLQLSLIQLIEQALGLYFFMLYSIQNELYPAHKCKNANNCFFGILTFMGWIMFMLMELPLFLTILIVYMMFEAFKFQDQLI